ncbi:MAG: MGMT family protein [Acidobacteria bacterium]|nr:MGMT family protein [Acidobacteriota bacterium]
MADRERLERVWALVRRVPKGKVSTYEDIAELADCTARQVGYALRMSPPGMRLPWHRILAAGGRIALPGDSGLTQRLKLEQEGVGFRGRKADLRAHRWQG